MFCFECTSLTVLWLIYSSNFILFDSIINGIAFLISSSDCLLLMYGNAIDFCVSILHPATFSSLGNFQTQYSINCICHAVHHIMSYSFYSWKFILLDPLSSISTTPPSPPPSETTSLFSVSVSFRVLF